MKLKGLAALVVGLALLGLSSWRMYQDLLRDPGSKYVFAVLLLAAIPMVVALSNRRSRDYIGGHRLGIGLSGIAVGFIAFAIFLYSNTNEVKLASWHTGAMIALAVAFDGFLVAVMPNMVRSKNKVISERF